MKSQNDAVVRNGAVWSAMFYAVDWVVHWAVSNAVRNTVYRNVKGAVSNVVYWAVERPSTEASGNAKQDDSDHPALQDFLREIV